MTALEDARNLLSMARRDFDALRGMIDNPLFADEIFGFHAQQAIEKGLKAWLCADGVPFPFTHDISRLLDLLENNGHDVAAFWPLVQYTVFAVQARYDIAMMADEPPLQRANVIAEIAQLVESVAARLSRG